MIPGLERSHFEPRKSTEEKAARYCKKGGFFYEHGKPCKGQGSRTDVTEFFNKVQTGASDLELMQTDFNQYARFQKSVDRYRSYMQPVRTAELSVHLFVGLPGTGKTRSAYDTFANLYAFPIGQNLWADGYMGQPDVLVDDFSGQLRLVDLLRFLDRYPIQIPRKGGFVWWCPTTIIITTNIHPRRWYKYEDRAEQEAALRRRIHYYWDFDNKDANGIPTELPVATYWP